MFICQFGMHIHVQGHRNANVYKQTYDACCTVGFANTSYIILYTSIEGVRTDRLACGFSLVIDVNGISVRFDIGLAADLVQNAKPPAEVV